MTLFRRIEAQLLGLIFSKANFLIPFKKRACNDFWLAYRHPKPAYEVHFLILPRKAWKNVFECPMDDPGVMAALLEIAAHLLRSERLEGTPCRLVINGGAYQATPILHAHLISG